ncbi:MAG: ribonuclease HI [Eubacterium sp.]|nr:ribonuclease HI [Eubacterium sp.]
MKVTIYTDGSAKGNPNGPGGYGTVLLYVDTKGVTHRREYSGGYKKTTNNRMELMGAIVGLEALLRPCQVDLYSDSQYLVKAFNDHWIDSWQRRNWKRGKNEPVKNADLWQRLLAACRPHEVTFHWIRGHAGNPENERCDQLAVQAALGEDLPEDPGVE